MTTTETPMQGKVTVAPDVLLTIARLSTLGVSGVARMSPVPGGVDRFFRPGANDGIRIAVQGNAVTVDLYLILRHDSNVREVSAGVQAEVARAFREMVGMEVTRVNVHVEDITFAPPLPSP